MNSEAVSTLISALRRALADPSGEGTVGILGCTSTALLLVDALSRMGCSTSLKGVYSANPWRLNGSLRAKKLENLREDAPSIVLVASDDDKEELIKAALSYLHPSSRILIAGYAHYNFQNPIFDEEVRENPLPSLANGYENSLIHIFQCLQNAARLNLNGIVAEFGMYKGGTTFLISQFVRRLGAAWKVYAFDSFAGFPMRRSALDMYSDSGCITLRETTVRGMLADAKLEIISGDIVDKAETIRGQPIVLAFIDTDNYSPAIAALNVVQNQIVPGGAIIFDHYIGHGLYTIGERMAAKRLLEDKTFFNLHGTGVFLKQCASAELQAPDSQSEVQA
jgi:O-methyltransferase